ncbi:glutathione S-transferase T3-like [Apium graveolens]|uniref:glutathione S-transferase T3-like n=1 Tax=Apium graveolens TaxID=4045 RepID=UPI003D78CAFB
MELSSQFSVAAKAEKLISQIPFSCPQNSPYQFPFPPFSNSQFETQQTPTDSQNSPRSQVPAFSNPNFINLNDDCEETEDVREITGQWKWVEDNLLISAWLNVSIDPLVGTDQKAEAFLERIHQYYEEDNPGVIKRGVIAMKKRWSRINDGAKKFGACYEKAMKLVGSGSNLKTISDKAHELHLTTYSKKSNFDRHWFELRSQPKWRTPSTTESSKRTKLSHSGNYSSSGNNDTPTNENVVESPVRPQGTKAAKRRGKGKARTVEADGEYEELRGNACRKLNLMQELNQSRQLELETRQKEIEAKRSKVRWIYKSFGLILPK